MTPTGDVHSLWVSTTKRQAAMTKIIVLFIWIGGGTAGEVAIPGFHSIEACKTAIVKLRTAFVFDDDEAQCIEFDAG